MKKIYTVTLDDDVPLSYDIASDVREIAFWLFEEINKFDRKILYFLEDENISKDGIYRNHLLDSTITKDGKYTYKFTSDNSMIDYRMFEPFMLSDTSFGFTVYDGSISDSEISIILNQVLKFLKFDYKFNIDGSVYYDDTKISSRLMAIDMIANKSIKKEEDKGKKRVKTKINPIFSVLGLAGR